MEEELVKRLKNQKYKERAFRELLDLYQERLYWLIRKIVISHDDANDVLQNTFIRIFKGIENFKGQSALLTWMYKIAYNESIRFLRKNNSTLTTSLNDHSSDYLKILTQDDYFDGDEIQLRLHQMISQLTIKQQRVFQMKYFDDLSFREISEILGLSESTLKSSYYSAVKIIEKKMVDSQTI
jgi:RNA polymerase sigma-70 factor (ECF subfamily)